MNAYALVAARRMRQTGSVFWPLKKRGGRLILRIKKKFTTVPGAKLEAQTLQLVHVPNFAKCAVVFLDLKV